MGFEATADAIGPGALWRALGARPTAVVMATTLGSEGPAGLLALSFAHVCAAPATVLLSAGPRASALPAILGSGVFAANVLPAGSEALARAFGGESQGAARFAGRDWTSFVTGPPVLASAAAVFDCRLERTVEVPGATLLIGRVAGLRAAPEGGAMLAVGGGYADFGGA